MGIPTEVSIPANELEFDFIRASGPGGQNVNKVASSVQLRFDVRNSPSLESDVKARLLKLAGSRVAVDGILIIEAKRFRSQEQNRADAIQRLGALIQRALAVPEIRVATKPSRASKENRLKEKKIRSQVKRTRSSMLDE